MYDYDNTYLFQFTLRRDGSLRFSKEEGRWGTFPGVVAGWIISNENFWEEHLKFINFLKLRASWAEMGNDQITAFQYLTSYQFGTGMALGSNRSYYSSLYQSNVPNPNITWEVANVYNAGFESIFLDNRFQFNTDFFYQRRKDILVKRDASVPNYIGLSLPDDNYGIVDNKGFEVVLGYSDKVGDLFYSLKGTYSYTINSVVEFDEPVKINDWQTLTGHPIGTQLLYNKIGVFKDSTQLNSYPHLPGTKPGDIILEDYNNDGKINSDDMILVDKTANPRSTYSININLTYKNWSLSTLFYGVGDCMKMKNQGNYKMYFPDNRWTKDNPTSDIPRTVSGHSHGVAVGGASTYSFLDASYFRLKNLNITYRLPTNVVNKIYLKEASLFASGENLFFLSKLKTPVDPELGQQGNQFSNYPLNRVLSLGVRVAF
jgi:TonB-linked SusC/RagA family outer membrane protein